MNKLLFYARAFKVPLIVIIGLFFYLLFFILKFQTLAVVVALVTIPVGSFKLLKETLQDIRNKQFGLDYIAILAVTVSVATHEYLVGIILALMLASGRNLEEFGASLAKRSLTELSERIPHDVLVEERQESIKKAVTDVAIGEVIIVRKGEVVPLDGYLESESGVFDESSLTGEAFPADKFKGDILRSGIVNLEEVVRVKVFKEEKDSTYKQIVLLVARAQSEKAPLVRIANKYSLYFTFVTLGICIFSFLTHGTLESILAVLVVATPCPLILATPIALIGGMNAQAKKRIIIKKLASIEALARVDTVVFDKTGTITLGKPQVTGFEVLDKSYDPDSLLSSIVAIERNSLHPLAKAVVDFGSKAEKYLATNVKETIGKGIEGDVDGKVFTLKKVEGVSDGMQLGAYHNGNLIAVVKFSDEIKDESKSTIEKLKALRMHLKIFTGDKKEAALALVEKMKLDIEVRAELKPEDKQKGIEELKKSGATVAMVGDGINDAPALALSSVGIVFANEEKTAASEAADIVLLGGNFSSVLYSLLSARRTISIAKQSILAGIGMSIVCMIFASFGLIPPLLGSLIQEGIDVAVILNALRASRS